MEEERKGWREGGTEGKKTKKRDEKEGGRRSHDWVKTKAYLEKQWQEINLV